MEQKIVRLLNQHGVESIVQDGAVYALSESVLLDHRVVYEWEAIPDVAQCFAFLGY